MVRKTATRKNKGSLKVKTGGQIRKAFATVSEYVHKNNPSVPQLRKKLKTVFGKDFSPKAVEDYLKVVKGKRSQKGGAAVVLSPASLGGADEMRTPAAGGVYTPPYVAGGFGGMNRMSFDGNSARGDQMAGAQLTPAAAQKPMAGGRRGTGKRGKGKSNGRKTRRSPQQGGNLTNIMSNLAQMTYRPFPVPGAITPLTSGNPTGYGADSQLRGLGIQTMASPRPEIPSFTFAAPLPAGAAYVSPASNRF